MLTKGSLIKLHTHLGLVARKHKSGLGKPVGFLASSGGRIAKFVFKNQNGSQFSFWLPFKPPKRGICKERRSYLKVSLCVRPEKTRSGVSLPAWSVGVRYNERFLTCPPMNCVVIEVGPCFQIRGPWKLPWHFDHMRVLCFLIDSNRNPTKEPRK